MKMTCFSVKVLYLLCFLVLNNIHGALARREVPHYGRSLVVTDACSGVISASVTFCSAKTRGLKCYCTNQFAMETYAECVVQLNANTSSYIDYFIKQCAAYNVTTSKEEFYQAYENASKTAVNISTIANFNKTAVFKHPILIDEKKLDLYYKSYRRYLANFDNSIYYGSGILGYWAAVLLIAAVVNWAMALFPSVVKIFSGHYSNLFRQHFSLAALGRKKRMEEQSYLRGSISYLVPNRIETAIVVGFLAVSLAVCTRDAAYIKDDPIYTTKMAQISKYAADRTGIVVCFIIPLLILFAGRNNFLQWVTKWHFSVFITFHRWVSRVAVILVFIHGVAFSVSYQIRGVYRRNMAREFIVCGILSLVAGSFMLFQGLLFLRRKWYECFLIIHIVLAVLFVVGAWRHCEGLGYGAFYYASVAIWSFDRFVRLVRLALFGFPKANIRLYGEHTVRISIPRPTYWKPPPGGHAFVHFLGPTYFWQSHPFTYVDGIDGKNKITLYCKIKGGVTHSLCKYLNSQPDKSSIIRVGIEGPYGERTAADKYDTAVFIAGGNGIPGIYSEISNLANRKVNRQHLKLYWIIKDWSNLEWFEKELGLLKNNKIEATIYVTKPDSDAPVFENSDTQMQSTSTVSSSTENEKITSTTEKDEAQFSNKAYSDVYLNGVQEQFPFIDFKFGRPDMQTVIKKEIQDSNGSIAFVTCGHPKMVDDIRYEVSENLQHSSGRVDFFEQLQVWA